MVRLFDDYVYVDGLFVTPLNSCLKMSSMIKL